MTTTTNKDKLRINANRQVTTLLDKLGVDYNDRGGLIQAICPCKQHGGDRDNTTAFSWRTDIGYWMCWTHHCQEQFGNDVFGLVRSVLQCDFLAAVRWVSDSLGEDVDISNLPAPAPRRKPGEIHIHDPLDETRLRFLKRSPKYLLDRGYSKEVLDKYDIGAWNRVGSYMHDRVVVPVRDHEDFLVGFTGRTVRSKEWFQERGLDFNKWLHGRYYDRFPKDEDPLLTGSILFNLNRAKTYLQPQRRMILVEGPLDGLKLEMYGIYNWVASLSTSFGPVHRSLLIKHGVSDLYVAYDNDPRKQSDKQTSSEAAWDRINKIVGDLFRIHRVGLPVGRDPGDMDEPEIRDTFLSISQSC
jgi:hypothetical protein